MAKKSILIIIFSITIFSCFDGAAAFAVSDCMIKALQEAKDTMTIGQLRRQCLEAEAAPAREGDTVGGDTAVAEERLEKEKENVLTPFALMAHKPNFLLPFVYNHSGYDGPDDGRQSSSANYKKSEVQFQFSVKTPVLVNLFDQNIDLYAAYTNHSFWQFYVDSSPFRETNHEPEVWLQVPAKWEFFGFTNTVNTLGLNHQSNGRGGDLSRSWNRILANFVFTRGNLAFSVKPWYRLPEEEESDDNPDITDYLGHYELRAIYKWDEHVFSLMSRNNFESGFSQGAIEATWSFPLWNYPFVKGYLQCFSGYGESLISYDNYVNKIGLGLVITDWF